MIAKIKLVKARYAYVPECQDQNDLAAMIQSKMITKENIGVFLVKAHRARIDVQIVVAS